MEVNQTSVPINRVALIAGMAKRNINCKQLVELSGVRRVTIPADAIARFLLEKFRADAIFNGGEDGTH